MSCEVTPQARGAAVQWTLNNSSSIEAVEISQTDVAHSTVRGVASTRLAGTWSCVVGYKGQEGRASANLTLKGRLLKAGVEVRSAFLYDLPNLRLSSLAGIAQPSKDNSKVYAALGSAATLPCVFSPGLSPTSAAWERVKPGSLLTPATGQLPASFSLSGPASRPGEDRSAVLKEVRLEDEGRYRCSGTVEGRRLTRDLRLVVAKGTFALLQSTTLFFSATTLGLCVFLLTVDISLPAYKADSVTLTCRLTDTSEVTRYEWVHPDFDRTANRSVTSTHAGKELTVDKRSGENQGEWTCRFYGEQGLLGNVTHHVTLMSTCMFVLTSFSVQKR